MIQGKTPSGLIVFLTDDEEKAIAKEALADRIHSHINRGSEIRKSIYSNIGIVVGSAVGGYILAQAAEWWKKNR